MGKKFLPCNSYVKAIHWHCVVPAVIYPTERCTDLKLPVSVLVMHASILKLLILLMILEYCFQKRFLSVNGVAAVEVPAS